MIKTRINLCSMRVNPINASFRKSFDKMLNQIPDGPGSCVVIGYHQDSSKIIDWVKSTARLRKEVRCGTKQWQQEKLSRYRWIQLQAKAQSFDSIAIQIID
jgi:hypothetical protein